MAEYISKDDLKRIVPEGIWEAIDNLKNADVAPVVHGKWIPHMVDDETQFGSECSECGCWSIIFPSQNYCSKCGARMDGGT